MRVVHCRGALTCVSVRGQILYANEGECRKEADMEPVLQGDKTNCLPHKGHEFIPTLYHFPSNCEACAKPLWHVFKPPPALECRRCHVKCHKDHLDKKEDVIAPCKGKELFAAGHFFIAWFHYCTFAPVYMTSLACRGRPPTCWSVQECKSLAGTCIGLRTAGLTLKYRFTHIIN